MGWKFKVGILVWLILVSGISFLVGFEDGKKEIRSDVFNKQLGFYEFNCKSGKVEFKIKINKEILK